MLFSCDVIVETVHDKQRDDPDWILSHRRNLILKGTQMKVILVEQGKEKENRVVMFCH